jgi:hypothetical protein
MLRQTYKTIEFPISKSDPDSMIAKYDREFFSDSDKATTVFLNAARDYIENDITADQFGSLCFSLISNKEYRKNISKDTELESVIFDCIDVSWVVETDSHSDFLENIIKFLKKRVESR